MFVEEFSMRTDHKQNLQTFTFTILEKWWVSELIPCIFYKKLEFSKKNRTEEEETEQ